MEVVANGHERLQSLVGVILASPAAISQAYSISCSIPHCSTAYHRSLQIRSITQRHQERCPARLLFTGSQPCNHPGSDLQQMFQQHFECLCQP